MPPSNKASFSDKFKQRSGRDPLFGTSADLHQVIEVDLIKLRPNPDQPRLDFDENFIKELADSIREKGLISPISIAADPDDTERYIIVAGEQRKRAFDLLERATIPAIVTSGDPAEIAIIENVQRRDLKPIEEARSYATLMNRDGYTQEQVAKVTGKGRTTITEILSLNTLPSYIQDECRTSDIPKSTLIEIARIDDDEAQKAAWTHAKSGNMTVRSARKSKQSKRGGNSRKSGRQELGDQAIISGNTLLKSLRELNERQDLIDSNTLQKLWQVSGEIHTLLASLEAKDSQHGSE